MRHDATEVTTLGRRRVTLSHKSVDRPESQASRYRGEAVCDAWVSVIRRLSPGVSSVIDPYAVGIRYFRKHHALFYKTKCNAEALYWDRTFGCDLCNRLRSTSAYYDCARGHCHRDAFRRSVPSPTGWGHSHYRRGYSKQHGGHGTGVAPTRGRYSGA